MPSHEPHEQHTPPEEHGREDETIRYYTLEGLFPPPHVLNVALGILTHLTQREGVPHPLVLGEQQVTERERDLLRPLLDTYPQFTPYEIIHVSFYQGYDRLSEQRIRQAQARLEMLREERLWDAEMRPIRNAMARLRLKLREVGLDSINVYETGYMLIKNPKWHAP